MPFGCGSSRSPACKSRSPGAGPELNAHKLRPPHLKATRSREVPDIYCFPPEREKPVLPRHEISYCQRPCNLLAYRRRPLTKLITEP